ncbi:hypothetical protein TWF281_007568 [Arthrobotrys megalospora]
MKVIVCLLALLGAASAAPNPISNADPSPLILARKPTDVCYRIVPPVASAAIAGLAKTVEVIILSQCQHKATYRQYSLHSLLDKVLSSPALGGS